MIRSARHGLLAVSILAPLGAAQTKVDGPAASQSRSASVVTVPTYPNSTCPIMGKKVSMKLFTDTELGRIYICCKGCDKKIHKDVPTAYKTAYPTTKTLANTTCPVSGESVGDKAVAVTLQGFTFRVCCPDCLPETQRAAQVVLARVTNDKVRDLRNAECPITGDGVTDNAFALIDNTLVRLSSPACADEIKKDPAGTLAKAKVLAASKQVVDPRLRAGAAETPPAQAEGAGAKKAARVPGKEPGEDEASKKGQR